jgi:transposase InsO family protein
VRGGGAPTPDQRSTVRYTAKCRITCPTTARFAANRTVEIALALNLMPCFTPLESPESNGMAEAFVKTFKRDYVRVNPIPNAVTPLPPLPSLIAG